MPILKMVLSRRTALQVQLGSVETQAATRADRTREPYFLKLAPGPDSNLQPFDNCGARICDAPLLRTAGFKLHLSSSRPRICKRLHPQSNARKRVQAQIARRERRPPQRDNPHRRGSATASD